MTTYYLDYEGGNDGNTGTSFAQRWKTITSGATAARIAPGDTIRVMGSSGPTSLGVNGTWVSGAHRNSIQTIVSTSNTTPIVVTMDSPHGLVNGDTVGFYGSSTHLNANGTWVVANKTSTTFELAGSTGNATGSDGALYYLTANIVTLASGLTQNIASFGSPGEIGVARTAWTSASGNVSTVLNSDNVAESYYVDLIDIGSGFGTGLAAYKNTGTLNLSGYQGVSLLLTGFGSFNHTLGDTELTLCTGTNGTTAVHHIPIPTFPNGQYISIYVDFGSNLNSAIQSVGLNVLIDRGDITFLISNVIAVRASAGGDNLNLTSLIGKNTTGETWYSLASINGTRAILRTGIGDVVQAIGYYGTNETVLTYKRETIKTTPPVNYYDIVQEVQDSGTAGNLISFEGGWDRTAMTTQNLETWFDGQSDFGIGLSSSGKSYISLNKINFVGYDLGVDIANGTGIVIPSMHSNCNSGGIQLSKCLSTVVGTVYACRNGGSGFIISGDFVSQESFVTATAVTATGNGNMGCLFQGGAEGSSIGTLISCASYCPLRVQSSNITIGTAICNGGNYYESSNVNLVEPYCKIGNLTANDSFSLNTSVQISSNFIRIGTLTINNNRGAALSLGGYMGVLIGGGSTSGNALGVYANGYGNYLRNFSIGESTEVDITDNVRAFVFSENHDNTVGNHKIFQSYGLISSTTAQRHTASGIAWAMMPTSAYATSVVPIWLSLAKLQCNASSLVTVKAWMRRDNTGLSMRLVCKGGQLTGVGSVGADITASMSVAANTWEQLTITFTPTEAGVVEITAEAYGGTTYTGYVDDLTLTQA